FFFFFFQAEDGIRDRNVTGVQTCALRSRSRKLPGGNPVYPARSTRCGTCAWIDAHSNNSENRFTPGGAAGDSAGDQRFHRAPEGLLTGLGHHDGGTHEDVRTARRNEL